METAIQLGREAIYKKRGTETRIQEKKFGLLNISNRLSIEPVRSDGLCA